jgi:hypothetical protein
MDSQYGTLLLLLLSAMDNGQFIINDGVQIFCKRSSMGTLGVRFYVFWISTQSLILNPGLWGKKESGHTWVRTREQIQMEGTSYVPDHNNLVYLQTQLEFALRPGGSINADTSREPNNRSSPFPLDGHHASCKLHFSQRIS